MPEPADNLAEAAPVGRAREAPQRERDHQRGRYPAPLNPGRSRNMQANKRTGTKPEVALRSILHRRGLRFRKDLPLKLNGIRVRPDVVFTRRRIAIFLDGCFWHVCPEHGRYPSRNDWYWTPKLRRNIERDKEVNQALVAAGWMPLRAWEHEDLSLFADRIQAALVRVQPDRLLT